MKAKYIFYDFDGVMTDNTVLVSEKGEEQVRVNRSDGLAISYFKNLGFKQFILSTEKNSVVSERAKKLKIECFQGETNKLNKLKEIMKKLDAKESEVIYVGNDLNDLEILNYIENTFCPSDSHEKILEKAKVILEQKGGNGVIMALYNYMEIQKNE